MAGIEPVDAQRLAFADTEARRRYAGELFDASAPDYDRVDRLLAFGTGSWYRRQALLRAGLSPDMRMLDVAIGTGLVAKEALPIVGGGGFVAGVDPSAGMIARITSLGPLLARGRGEALPYAAASFDFLCLGYALRHLADLRPAFAEFRRVLRPGGRLLLLEITRPEGRVANALLKAYLRGLVPVLARLVARSAETPVLYRYYWDTIEACVPPAQILEALGAAGFAGASRYVELGIFSEYTARVAAPA